MSFNSKEKEEMNNQNSPLESRFTDFFIGLVVVVIIGSILFMGFRFSYTGNVAIAGTDKSCGDGTFYNSCSLSKPYFCSEGILEEKASICGCPKGMHKDGDFCFYKEYTNSEDKQFYYFLNGKRSEIKMTLYAGVEEYVSNLPRAIKYSDGETPSRADFKLNKINDEIQREAIMPLVIRIENLAPNSKVDQARIAISLVQNLNYEEPKDYLEFDGKKITISNFPYQTIYTGAGSCEGKSELLVLLLREIGYGTGLFYYPIENHEAVALKCPVENSLRGSGYCFVETTSSSIITDNGGDYLGAGKLIFDPELYLLSDGIPLPKDMYEYEDAKILDKIREKGNLNIFTKNRWIKLLDKYGISYSF